MGEFLLYHSIQEIQPFIIMRLVASHGWPPSADRRTGRQGSKKWPQKSRDLNPLAYTDVPETAGLARSINP